MMMPVMPVMMATMVPMMVMVVVPASSLEIGRPRDRHDPNDQGGGDDVFHLNRILAKNVSANVWCVFTRRFQTFKLTYQEHSRGVNDNLENSAGAENARSKPGSARALPKLVCHGGEACIHGGQSFGDVGVLVGGR